MNPIDANAKAALRRDGKPRPRPAADPSRDAELRQARRAIDGALSRDRGRLHGLWSRWSAKPADDEAQAAFAKVLAASVSQREARAGSLPHAPVDPSLPIAGEAARIVEVIRTHPGVVIAGAYGHSRLREWVLGGVTRHLATESRRCAFLSR